MTVPPTRSLSPLKLLTAVEVCSIFAITSRTLYSWVHDPSRPPERRLKAFGGGKGAVLRFLEGDVLAFIEANRCQAAKRTCKPRGPWRKEKNSRKAGGR